MAMFHVVNSWAYCAGLAAQEERHPEEKKKLSRPTASRLSVEADKSNMAGQAEYELDVGGGGRKGVEVCVSQVLVAAVLLCHQA